VTTRDDERYGIEELAERAGVSRRTVRYYVQRGLLPAPTGIGRGRHYTEEHLATLVRIRELQERGESLADIADAITGSPRTDVEPGPVEQTLWSRVVLDEGLELHVRGRRLDEATVRALRHALARVMKEGDRDHGR
jgi:DNA-binding transcriptional MerR regulator